jgi:hypothetical protein
MAIMTFTESDYGMLVQVGYWADLNDTERLGAIWLHHPRDGYAHRMLVLHGSGDVMSVSATEKNKVYLGRGEKTAFSTFLRSVPRPTWWEQTRRSRVQILNSALVFGFFLGFWFIVEAALMILRALLN